MMEKEKCINFSFFFVLNFLHFSLSKTLSLSYDRGRHTIYSVLTEELNNILFCSGFKT